MTKEGYHTEKELRLISKWDYNDVLTLIDYLNDRWHFASGFKRNWGKESIHGKPIIHLELHTGGWSGNEDLINALLANKMFSMMWYAKWERGGHYYFEINPYNFGYETVAEYCKKRGISRQAVHQNKRNYEWIEVTPNLKLIKPKQKSQP